MKTNYKTRLHKLVEITNNPWFKWDDPARNAWGTAVLKLEISGAEDFDTLARLEKNNPGDGFIYAAANI